MGLRVLNEEEILQLAPPVQQTQGVTTGERFVLKNFATNPAAARGYLESLGYEVRPYGKGFNFAVRKGGEGASWQVVDPKGMDPEDILDLVTDFIGGGLAGFFTGAAAAASGGLAAVGAGIASSAGVEAARQGIGTALGIPDNTSVGSIAAIGAVGGAFPAAGAAIRGGARLAGRAIPGAGNIASELASRIAGLGNTAESLPGSRVLQEGARFLKKRGGKGLRSVGETTRDLRIKIATIDDSFYPETVALANALKQSGRTTHVTRAFGEILDVVRADPKRGLSKSLSGLRAQEKDIIKNMIDESNAITDFMVGIGVDPGNGRMTVWAANEVRRFINRRAADAKGFVTAIGAPKTKQQTGNILKATARRLNTLIGEEMDGVRIPVTIRGSEFTMTSTGLLARMSLKERQRQEIFKVMGIGRGGRLDGSLAAGQKAENYINGVFGLDKGRGIRLLRDVEQLFDVGNLEARALEANIAQVLGQQPGLLPRFTATGSFLGPSLLAGAGFFGGPAALIGGVALASPRVIVKITQALQSANLAGRALTAGGRPGTRGAVNRATIANFLLTGLERTARQRGGMSIAREDPKRPKPTVLRGDF